MLACDQQRYNNRVGLCPLRPPFKPATVCSTLPCSLVPRPLPQLFLRETLVEKLRRA